MRDETAAQISVSVQTTDFDVSAEIAALSEGRLEVGAAASFVGLVRDVTGDLVGFELEHYPGMTEKALQEIAEAAARRWPLSGARIVHRYGPLAPGDRIVLALATSAHRRAALEAVDFMMDYLKTQAPFWKRETTAAGSTWVDAREADHDAAARWRG